MKLYLLQTIFALVAAFCAFAQTTLCQTANADLQKRVGEIVEAGAAGDNFSGSMLLAKNGKVIYHKSFGFADRAAKTRFSLETPSSVASIGKVFTAVLILKLAETGKLSLNDKISKFLPAANLPNAGEMTVKHLLTHTSGFGDYMNHPDYSKVQKGEFALDDLINLIAAQPLVFKTPGERFEYSNSGYIVLGKIIEAVTMKKYAEVLKKEILQPLKMKNTHFEFSPEDFQNAARGHRKDKAGEWQTSVVKRLPIFSSDGGIFTTSEDLFRFHKALFGGKIIARASFGEMKKRQVEAVVSASGNRAYGYGLMITDYAGGAAYSIGHNGGSLSFDARYKHFYAGQNEYTLIIIANYGDSIRPLLNQIETLLLKDGN